MGEAKYVPVPDPVRVRIFDGRLGFATDLSKNKVVVQLGPNGPFETFWWKQIKPVNPLDYGRLRKVRPKSKPISPERKRQRDATFRHNGLQGSVAMARQQMRAVQQTETVTAEGKKLAAEIEFQLVKLAELLRERKEIGDGQR